MHCPQNSCSDYWAWCKTGSWSLEDEGNPNGIDAIASDCKSGLNEIPMVQIQHYYRDANKCADALLAKRGSLLSQDFVVILEPLADVLMFISLDAVGISYDCFVSSLVSVV